MARTARLSTGGPDSALCSARTWVTNGVRTWVTLLRFTIGWPTRYHEGREMFARRCTMSPYSMDLRERVAAAVDLHAGSQRQIARRFRVSLSFITRLLRRRRSTGALAPKPHGGGHPPALDQAGQQCLRQQVQKQPDATLQELAAREAAGLAPRAARASRVPRGSRAARSGAPGLRGRDGGEHGDDAHLRPRP